MTLTEMAFPDAIDRLASLAGAYVNAATTANDIPAKRAAIRVAMRIDYMKEQEREGSLNLYWRTEELLNAAHDLEEAARCLTNKLKTNAEKP